MAQIDSTIALGVKPMQIESPVNQMAKVLQLQGFQQDQQDRTMKRERENRLTQVLGQSYGKPEEREEALLRGGFVDQATKLSTDRRANLKSDAETEAKKFETANKRVEVLGQTLGFVRQNPTVENATQAIQYLVSNGIMPPEKAQEAMAKFQADPTPQGIAAFAEMGFRAALATKEQLAKTQTNNTGGKTVTQAIDPVTGKATTVSAIQNTQSPDSIASNATQRRGQDMTDQRQREATAATMTKPFEITGEDGKPVLVQQDKQGNIRPVAGYGPRQGASKPLTEGQSKALLFGSRMQDSGAIIDELANNGVTKSIPGSRAGYGVGATINALQPQDRQRLDQAKRDFVNAVLRRESGAVISAEEFANAEQQYFPQPGEGKDAIEQKRRAREVATRGILAEVPDADARVAKVRGNGAAPAGGGTPKVVDFGSLK